MLVAIRNFVVLTALMVCTQANASLLFFSDRSVFESSLNSAMVYEGFNDNELEYLNVQSGFVRYRTTSSLVTEGEKALVLKESNAVTFTFDEEVYAFGFYVNELNSTNLTYTDSLGNELLDALKVTEVWNASTFFGVTSEVGIRSFTLTGAGSQTALFGIDGLQFTGPDVAVNEPASIMLLVLAFFVMITTKRLRKH